LPRFGFQIAFGSGHHSEKEFRFTRFLFAGADLALELFLGNSVISFAVICANTCGRANQLTNKPIIAAFGGIFFANRITASPNKAVRSSKS
jgi:hypothetical protein